MRSRVRDAITLHRIVQLKDKQLVYAVAVVVPNGP